MGEISSFTDLAGIYCNCDICTESEVKIMKILDIFAGKKTYVIAALMVVYGVAGYLLGEVNLEVAGTSVLGGLGLITGRRAVDR